MTTVKEAVAARFVRLMKERGIKTNELANRSDVTPSSVYSMLDPRRKEVSVNLVKSSATVWTSPWASSSLPLCLTIWSRRFNKSSVRVCGLSRPTVYKHLKMMG